MGRALMACCGEHILKCRFTGRWWTGFLRNCVDVAVTGHIMWLSLAVLGGRCVRRTSRLMMGAARRTRELDLLLVWEF